MGENSRRMKEAYSNAFAGPNFLNFAHKTAQKSSKGSSESASAVPHLKARRKLRIKRPKETRISTRIHMFLTIKDLART